MEYIYGGVTFNIKKYIGIADQVSFVNDVAEMCFVDGKFYPSVLPVVFKYFLILYFMNVPKDVTYDSVEHLIYDSDAVESICKHANACVADLKESVDKEILYRTNNINILSGKLYGIAEEISNAIGSIENINSLLGFEHQYESGATNE